MNKRSIQAIQGAKGTYRPHKNQKEHTGHKGVKELGWAVNSFSEGRAKKIIYSKNVKSSVSFKIWEGERKEQKQEFHG